MLIDSVPEPTWLLDGIDVDHDLLSKIFWIAFNKVTKEEQAKKPEKSTKDKINALKKQLKELEEQDKKQEKSFSREDYDKAVDFAVKKHNQRTADALLTYTEILLDAKEDYEREVSNIREAFYTRNRSKIVSESGGMFKGGHSGKGKINGKETD